MKITHIILLITIILSFSACGGKKTPVNAEPTPTITSPTQDAPVKRQVQPQEPQPNTRETNKVYIDETEAVTETEIKNSTQNNRTSQQATQPTTQRTTEPKKDEKIPLLSSGNQPVQPEEKNSLTPSSPIPPSTISSGTISSGTTDNDGITMGITGITRGFGYSGKIDVPENFKHRVAYYIRYFSHDPKGSRFYQRAMQRGEKHLPMIREALRKKQLPLSLAYLPLVESGFSRTIRSHAGAVGMWQFMTGTARMYGLKVNRRIDERTDPRKATYAATEYLNDLLAMFGSEDPFLGISAYNAGEGKIMRALRNISYKDRSFWTLVKHNLLRSETDEYIPRLLAVILMANNPEKYVSASFKEKTIRGENDDSGDSGDSGDNTDSSPIELEDNEIVSSFHPSREDLSENGDETIDDEDSEASSENSNPKENNGFHIVQPGENLYRISLKYNLKVGTLKKLNNLNDNTISIGQRLNVGGGTAVTPPPKRSAKGLSGAKGYKLTYTVNTSDSLVRIALLFKGVSARSIMRWNNLKQTRIYPKQKLTILLPKTPRKVINYQVKRGDTAAKIARRHNSRIAYILSLNGLLYNTKLQPGMKLKIYYF